MTTAQLAPWRLVAARELRIRLRSKAFWISTISTLVIIVGAAVVWHLIPKGGADYRIGVTEDSSARIVAAAGRAGATSGQDSPTFTAVRYADAERAEGAVTDGAVDAALTRAASGWTLTAKKQPDAALSSALHSSITAVTASANAAKAGLDLSTLTAGTQLTPVALDGSADRTMVAYTVTFLFGLLFFLSCQLFGTSTASSVVEEKESRVVEVLLSAISSRQLLVGKVVGNALVGIVQMTLFVGAGLLAAWATGGIPQLGDIVSSSGIFLAFYLVGFVTMCFLFGGLGSLASRAQDMQSATAPLQIVITAAYMISFVGSEAIVKVTSYVPILSTVTMPSRALKGTATWWEVAIAVTIAVGFAVVSVRLADRAYRGSVLQLGPRLELSSILGRRRAASRGRAAEVQLASTRTARQS